MEKVEISQPTLVFMAGRPSSGKSTFIRQVLPYVKNLFLIDKDTLNDTFLTDIAVAEGSSQTPLFESHASLDEYDRKNKERLDSFISLARNWNDRRLVDRDTPTYKDHIRLQSYLVMLTLANDNLSTGKSVVLDAPHIKEMKIQYFDRIAPQIITSEYQIKAVLCHAPEEVLKRRIRAKGEKRDDYMQVDEKAWRLDLQKEPIIPQEIESYDHIKIDTSKDTKENIRRALEFLVL